MSEAQQQPTGVPDGWEVVAPATPPPPPPLAATRCRPVYRRAAAARSSIQSRRIVAPRRSLTRDDAARAANGYRRDRQLHVADGDRVAGDGRWASRAICGRPPVALGKAIAAKRASRRESRRRYAQVRSLRKPRSNCASGDRSRADCVRRLWLSEEREEAGPAGSAARADGRRLQPVRAERERVSGRGYAERRRTTCSRARASRVSVTVARAISARTSGGSVGAERGRAGGAGTGPTGLSGRPGARGVGGAVTVSIGRSVSSAGSSCDAEA
jgi:hypothetical protein